jgi:tRNA-specific 2-thiouridylase
MSTQTIAVAMSGGVDSSTVAAMLRAEGHNVVGLTMQLWNQRRLAGREGMPEQVQGRCCSIDDVYDARRVAEDLGIPYYVVNHEERFERDVVRPFIDEYLSGRTPIPCSLCNNHLKFDQLLITARQIGADLLATGHYARCEFDAGRNRWLLRRAADPAKDQTYFLFGLTQEQPNALSPGPYEQAAGARTGARAPSGSGGEARLAGDMLCPRRRLQAIY